MRRKLGVAIGGGSHGSSSGSVNPRLVSANDAGNPRELRRDFAGARHERVELHHFVHQTHLTRLAGSDECGP